MRVDSGKPSKVIRIGFFASDIFGHEKQKCILFLYTLTLPWLTACKGVEENKEPV